MGERRVHVVGNLLVVLGLVVGLAVAAFLYQWDSSQRASLASPAPGLAPRASAAGGPPGPASPASSEVPGERAIQAGKVVYSSFCNA